MSDIPGNSGHSDDSPWLKEKNWKNGSIVSSARNSFHWLLFFAVAWNLFSFPIAWFAIGDIYPGMDVDHLDPVLFVLIFPLVGLLLLPPLIKSYRQWKAFGVIPLTLDPYPGGIGSEVGGFLDINHMGWRRKSEFVVTVSCIQHRISGSGKNTSHHQDIIWQKQADCEYDTTAGGIRLKFLAQIDESLPESESVRSNRYHRWVVRVTGTNPETRVKLAREYDIPVFRQEQPVRSRIRVLQKTQKLDRESISNKQIVIDDDLHQLTFYYPASRRSGAGAVLLFIALAFGIPALFLGHNTWEGFHEQSSFSLFMMGVTGIMTLIFAAISLSLFLYSLHLVSHTLRVFFLAEGIRVISRSILRRSDNTIPYSEITALRKRNTMRSGQGAGATLYYEIYAQLTDGGKLVLGNGIKGQPLADSLLERMERQLGKYGVIKPVNEGQTETPEDVAKNIEKKKISRWVKLFKQIMGLLVFLLMMLFALDFLSIFL